MSTVAYRDGIMASDSACVSAGIVQFHVTKMYELDCGSLCGICGDADHEPLLRILQDGEEGMIARVTIDRDALNDVGVTGEALVVTPDGTVHYIMCGKKYCDHVLAVPMGPRAYYAIGHGKELALGAMAAGELLGIQVDAVTAVRAAAVHSTTTCLPVHALTFRAPHQERLAPGR